MNLRSIIAALPFLRWLWRWLPGPLKIVVIAAAAVVAIARLLRGDTPHDEVPPATSDDPSADDPPR